MVSASIRVTSTSRLRGRCAPCSWRAHHAELRLTAVRVVATATAAWVDALAGTTTMVRNARKTVPGLRVLQKYAVRYGGDVNHRMGLDDAALIKDNHIAATESVAAALDAVHRHAPEVECDRLDQVAEAIKAGEQLVLLDGTPAVAATGVDFAASGH